MKGVLIPTDGLPVEIDLREDASGSILSDLQGRVGGYIELFNVIFGDGIDLYINEEGLYTCPPNRAVYATPSMEQAGCLSCMDYAAPIKAGELYSILHGDIVAVGYDPMTGKSRELTAEEIATVSEYFTEVSTPGSALREILAIQLANSIPSQSREKGPSPEEPVFSDCGTFTDYGVGIHAQDGDMTRYIIAWPNPDKTWQVLTGSYSLEDESSDAFVPKERLAAILDSHGFRDIDDLQSSLGSDWQGMLTTLIAEDQHDNRFEVPNSYRDRDGALKAVTAAASLTGTVPSELVSSLSTRMGKEDETMVLDRIGTAEFTPSAIMRAEVAPGNSTATVHDVSGVPYEVPADVLSGLKDAVRISDRAATTTPFTSLTIAGWARKGDESAKASPVTLKSTANEVPVSLKAEMQTSRAASEKLADGRSIAPSAREDHSIV